MSKTTYWINLGDGEGFEFFDTEAEMLERGTEILADAKSDAELYDEWPDDIVENSWTMGTMTVTHRVVRVPVAGKPIAEDGWRCDDVDYAWSNNPEDVEPPKP